MTPDDGLRPEEDEEVRRLLAAAAEPVATPNDVVDRLDRVLADLHAERDRDADAPVADLSDRRSRRWPKVLVAAAAVAVVGVGVGNLVNQVAPSSQSDSTSSADSAAGGSANGPKSQEMDSTGPVGADTRTSALPQVRRGSAKVDAQRVYDHSHGANLLSAPSPGRRTVRAACELPTVSKGEKLVAVRLDRKRATLLFRAGEGGHRRAEVYSCDDSEAPVLVTRVNAR